MDNSEESEFIKQKYSKRHHYLPVFYLKGFTDADELLYVYDKEKDTILPRQNPESKFYEKHLNNYKFDGEVRFTLEEPVFSPLDAKGAVLFKKMREAPFTVENQLTPTEKFSVLDFIARLYWRSPESNQLFIELIKKEGLSNKYFGFALEGEEDFLSDDEIPHIKAQFLSDKEIQKVFKHVVPLSNGTAEEIYRLYSKWQLFSLNVEATNIIVGDNPFLINNENVSLDNVFNELIFPIGKHKLLVLADKFPNFLDANLMMFVNLSILHQSKRFIACDSEEQLKQLLVHYNRLIQMNLDKNLVKETFGVMEYQSSFKSYTDYCKAYEEGKRKYQLINNRTGL